MGSGPPAVVARTLNLRLPCATAKLAGLVQAAHALPLSSHWNSAAGSSLVNSKVAVVLLVSAGGLAVMVVEGPGRSIVHQSKAASWYVSALPAASVAINSKTQSPSSML